MGHLQGTLTPKSSRPCRGVHKENALGQQKAAPITPRYAAFCCR